MGLSDRVQIGTLEERMDDVRAVMDEIGSKRAALIGESEGGPMAMLFASTVKDLVAGSGIELVDRGLFALKGVEGERRLYSA